MENHELDTKLSCLTKEKWWEDNYVYQFGGFWHMPLFIKPIKRVINNFNPLSSDVILATFPKTGTTWLKSLLYSIINQSSKHILSLQHPHELIPFLEAQVFTHSGDPSIDAGSLDANHSCRIFNTHIPYQLWAKTLDSCESWVIYLTRNPKDTLISAWNFANKLNLERVEQWPLDVAVDQFCRGIFLCMPYYDHVIGYRELSSRRPKNVLFLTYEEMMEDTHGCVKKLGDFLECPFESEDEVEEIVKNCSIEVLSSHDVNKSEEIPTWFPTPYNSFFSKGVVGDYKNYLNDEAIQRIDTLTKKKFHSLGFMYGI
ncbi:hypothetical protein C2S53_011096 [Perilla frutescens var. hirtella]|uniref:Sulfotransferase n=1 Tax=Perilla frutescens var. hirtella TaxID=608512 RepID=A0AAD4JA08_PERFH|nr:hypothetical protein C2S53_011096 [Perilla frutescens var. hirtella]